MKIIYGLKIDAKHDLDSDGNWETFYEYFSTKEKRES